MKGKNLWIAVGVLLALVVIVAVIQSGSREAAKPDRAKQADSQSAALPTQTRANHIPAHYETPPAIADLSAVLPSSQFAGKTRQAYEAVKQIPVTIAQMPCYCHCDQGMGHKSLHSCFEDDHAAHCATCVDEALMAYRLQKEEGLSPAQIRERIVAQYSGQ
jgi:hypothetical protein